MAAVTAGIAFGVGSTVYGARQARKAADRQAAGYDAATQEQARQFDVLQEAQAPYQQVGSAALNQLAALYGLPQYSAADPNAPGSQPMGLEEFIASKGGIDTFPAGDGVLGGFGKYVHAKRAYDDYVANFQPATPEASAAATGAPDFASFFSSPDYQFALQQGQQSVQNSAAAQGGLYSGNALRALTDYGQGAATQYLNNYANRLAGIAGVGQTAATNVGNAAMQTGANIGNLMVGAGNARASGAINQANLVGNLGNQLGMLYGMGAFGGSPFGGGGQNTMAYNWGGPRYGGLA